jgi:hypothetical protein
MARVVEVVARVLMGRVAAAGVAAAGVAPKWRAVMEELAGTVAAVALLRRLSIMRATVLVRWSMSISAEMFGLIPLRSCWRNRLQDRREGRLARQLARQNSVAETVVRVRPALLAEPELLAMAEIVAAAGVRADLMVSVAMEQTEEELGRLVERVGIPTTTRIMGALHPAARGRMEPNSMLRMAAARAARERLAAWASFALHNLATLGAMVEGMAAEAAAAAAELGAPPIRQIPAVTAVTAVTASRG